MFYKFKLIARSKRGVS